MLPPAPRVVGSSRRSSGTLRAGADQGAGAGLQHGVVRRVGDASVAGLCHGCDRSSTCINEACQSQKHRHAPFAANFAAGPHGGPRPRFSSQKARSCKPRGYDSFEPLHVMCATSQRARKLAHLVDTTALRLTRKYAYQLAPHTAAASTATWRAQRSVLLPRYPALCGPAQLRTVCVQARGAPRGRGLRAQPAAGSMPTRS